MNAIEYALKILESEEPARTEHEVMDAVLANPELTAELAGNEIDLRREHPAIKKFAADVMEAIAAREARGVSALRIHASCQVFYCDNCEARYSIEEADGVWNPIRESLEGECPDCGAIMFGDDHEEACTIGA